MTQTPRGRSNTKTHGAPSRTVQRQHRPQLRLVEVREVLASGVELAEQHLLHLGRSPEPVCWTLIGFASGYLSHAHGQAIYCLERACRGRGDSMIQAAT